MKPSPISKMYGELDSLASASIDGQLTGEDAARLRELFDELPDARQRFAEHFFLDVAITDELEAGSNLRELSSRSRPGRHWRRWVALAAAVAVSAAAVGLMPKGEAPHAREERGVVDDTGRFGVATILEVVDVEWADAKHAPKTGEPLEPQVLELDSGLLHFAFYSGASVILEGPAKFELVSPELGIIHFGKLRTHVPPAAKGFTIKTETFEILDLGTEFAVDMSRDGTAQVHVIDGEVVLTKNSAPAEPQHLHDGEGMGLGPVGEISRFASRPDEFVGAQEFGVMSRARGSERARESRAMAERLRSDPAAIAYYSFSRNGSWGTRLENEVAGAGSPTDGTVVGCRWIPGRWAGDGALQFSKSSDRVRIDLPGTYGSLSMAAWLKIDAIETRTISITSPITDQGHFVHWVLRRRACGKLLSLNLSETTKIGWEEQRRSYHSDAPIEIAEILGRWIHLAVTYDPLRGEVTHFLDGEKTEVIPEPDPRPLGIGSADLGNWPYREWAAGTEWEHRHLQGAFGEFVALSRVLSPEEVAEIFRSGRP